MINDNADSNNYNRDNDDNNYNDDNDNNHNDDESPVDSSHKGSIILLTVIWDAKSLT